MIQSGKNIYDLAELELAYAPPFSSAKDPVNLAGMIAINQLEGKNPVIFWDELDALKKEGVTLIDVRSSLEFELAHIEGATNIPLDDIRDRLKEIPKDKKVVLYCNQGKKTYCPHTIYQV